MHPPYFVEVTGELLLTELPKVYQADLFFAPT
jgi:hypothetical protein